MKLRNSKWYIIYIMLKIPGVYERNTPGMYGKRGQDGIYCGFFEEPHHRNAHN